jgi:hypothetical protein
MTEDRRRLPGRVTGAPILRNRVAVWRGERELVVVDGDGERRLAVDWAIDRLELAADGQYVLAFGDGHRRAQVWSTASGTSVLQVEGDGRRHSLHGGLAQLGGAPCALTAVRDKTMSITDLRDGSQPGWLSITGYTWFQVERVVGLPPAALAVIGHIEGEQYDSVVVVPAQAVLDDSRALMTALSAQPTIKEWGYVVAVGPVGGDAVAIFRDPQWEADDVPEDPAEAFRGLVVYDLPGRAVQQRIAYPAVPRGAALGGDASRLAIECPGHVEVVSRGADAGAVRRVEAVALDVHRLEIARIDGDQLVIAPLP